MDNPRAPVTFHANVMSPAQQDALRTIGPALTRSGFYLGGGTAVAIYLGHRCSLDFDWFNPAPIGDPLTLAARLRGDGIPLEVAEVSRGTLHATVHGIRTTLLEYAYPHVAPPVDLPDFACRLASLEDLATLKLSAIAGRGSQRKDFVDLYGLVTRFKPLEELIGMYRRRYAVPDEGHLRYALAWFDDAEQEPMPDMLWDLEWPAVRQGVEGWVRDLR